ncbi:MAG: hypothetical protein R2879_15120 [Saprospiraceae bacterium]
MEIKRLKQRFFLGSNTLEISDKELRIDSRDFISGNRERIIPLSEIKKCSEKSTSFSIKLMIVFCFAFYWMIPDVIFKNILFLGVFGDFGVIYLFILTLLYILVSRYIIKEKEIIIPTTEEPIVLYSNKYTQEKVDSFINEIFQASDNFFKNAYGIPDKNLPFETQCQNFHWLKINGIITASDYENLVNNLTALKRK